MYSTLRKTLAPAKRAVCHHWRRPNADSFGPDQTVVLASSGRSGSTWLAQLLNWDNEFRYVFEPLHQDWVPEFQSAPNRIYLTDDPSSSEWLSDVESVFLGRSSNPWADQFNRNRTAQRQLIKCIRANVMLNWFVRRFPEAKLVFLLRNPFAQAVSARKGNWELDLTLLTRQNSFCRDWPELASDLEQNANRDRPFLRSIWFWCVENWIPLATLPANAAQFVFYESIVENPESELRSLFKYVDKPFDSEVLKLVEKRSKTARSAENDSPLTRWKNLLTTEQIESGRQIMARFGFDKIYDPSGRPCCGVSELGAIARTSRYGKDSIARNVMPREASRS